MDFGVVRDIIISKNQGLRFIHILVTILYLPSLLHIDNFYELKRMRIFKNNLSADITLLKVVYFSGEGIRANYGKLLQNFFQI